jgi:hypothetical protein
MALDHARRQPPGDSAHRVHAERLQMEAESEHEDDRGRMVLAVMVAAASAFAVGMGAAYGLVALELLP